jgi:hypothetical protein
MGRPKIPIDWDNFERMCRIHCTQEEIASLLVISVDTLERGCKRKYKKTFAEVYREKTAGGKMSLRRAMWRKALGQTEVQHDPKTGKKKEVVIQEASNTMMIWLSKNHLGMTDRYEDTTPPDTAPKKPAVVQVVFPEFSREFYDQQKREGKE